MHRQNVSLWSDETPSERARLIGRTPVWPSPISAHHHLRLDDRTPRPAPLHCLLFCITPRSITHNGQERHDNAAWYIARPHAPTPIRQLSSLQFASKIDQTKYFHQIQSNHHRSIMGTIIRTTHGGECEGRLSSPLGAVRFHPFDLGVGVNLDSA